MIFGFAAGLLSLAGADRAQAEAQLLIEASTGKVLHAENATYPWYPASVTKLMTAYTTLRAIKEGRISLNTLLTMSRNAAAQQPTKMGFSIGTTVSAAASGKLPEVLCSVNTAWPMKYCELPSTVGTTKSPSVNANVKIDPATTPGKANGQITCRKVAPGFAPRSPEASSKDFGTRSSAASIEMIM